MFYIFLFIAGGSGVAARYLLGRLAVHQQWTALPYGTLMANLIGCFLIGFLSTWFVHRWSVSQETQAVILSGFLGGFTTFSAFSLEAVMMFQQDGNLRAVSYVLIKVTLCVLLCFAGILLARS